MIQETINKMKLDAVEVFYSVGSGQIVVTGVSATGAKVMTTVKPHDISVLLALLPQHKTQILDSLSDYRTFNKV